MNLQIKDVKKLKVIEMPYRNLKYTHFKREFDDYKLCGLYYKTGKPFEVVQVYYPEEKFDKGYGEFYPRDPKDYSIAFGVQNSYICAEAKKAAENGECILLTGGGCDHIQGILGGLQQAFGHEKKVGFLWLDAHGDYNTPDITLSGRPGGMCLSTCTGECCDEWRIGAGIIKPIPYENVLLTDARELDPLEKQLLEKRKILIVNTEEFNDEKTWTSIIKEFSKQVDYIVMHIDQDIIDARYIPNSWTPSSGGPDRETIMRNVKIVMETDKVAAMSMVSVTFINNKPGQEERTINAMRVVGAALESWKKYPSMI